MPNKALVAYASKYGSTAQIADKIGEVLKSHGLNVDELPVESVTDLSAYWGVVVGSAVYAGQWRKEAVQFLERYESELARKATWLFSSGPTGHGDPVELMNGWKFPEDLQGHAARIGPRDIAFFHGAIDVDKLSLGEKMIVKALRAPTGDFRDWQAIESWSESIADYLTEPAAQAGSM